MAGDGLTDVVHDSGADVVHGSGADVVHDIAALEHEHHRALELPADSRHLGFSPKRQVADFEVA